MTSEARTKAREILKAARRLVASGWAQGAPARRADGERTRPVDADAAGWSTDGALYAAGSRAGLLGDAAYVLAEATLQVATGAGARDLAWWNDRPDRTLDQVVGVFSRAAEALKEEEEPNA